MEIFQNKKLKETVTQRFGHEYSLFITAKNQKQPKCPSSGEQIKCDIIHRKDLLFKNKKKYTTDKCYNTWMNLKKFHQSERS